MVPEVGKVFNLEVILEVRVVPEVGKLSKTNILEVYEKSLG